MVESLPGTGAVAGPDDGGLCVVVRQGPSAGKGQVWVLRDLALVRLPGGLGGAFGLEVGIDS